jgi:chemotaxis protein methyltransferase CheR
MFHSQPNPQIFANAAAGIFEIERARSACRHAAPAHPEAAADAVFFAVRLVCRPDLLMDLHHATQDPAPGLFARSLPPGGFLGLGSKETISFSAQSEGWRRNTHDVQEVAFAE